MSLFLPSGKAAVLGAAAAVVVLAVGAALWLMDSPTQERQRRLDERRVSDLQAIERALDIYFSRHGGLPETLSELGEGYGVAERRHDPVSGEPYGYRATGERSHELCATFDTASPAGGDDRWRVDGYFWSHPRGHHCFEIEATDVNP